MVLFAYPLYRTATTNGKRSRQAVKLSFETVPAEKAWMTCLLAASPLPPTLQSCETFDRTNNAYRDDEI